ncbi:MAG: putative peptide transport system permease [Thermoleophilia bacterium]|nr:putative peptide transport system permease [Thermoleophilia bacterium]MCZ4495547.1 putative peptide transport system permease [Thermoleophilia bacterium]
MSARLHHVIRRLVRAATTLLAASAVVFLLVMVGPDPLATIAQESDGIDTKQLAAEYGWDRPWPEQYLDWLGDALRGDLGTSIRTNEDAGSMIVDRLPVTLALGGASMLVALATSVLLALWASARRNQRGDRVVTGLMVAMGALPSFLLALALQWLAVQAKDLFGVTIVYVGGMPREPGLLELIQRFALPVLVLAMVQVAAWMRFLRSDLVDALESDMVVAARGQGLPERQLRIGHALRISLAPLVTLVALEIGTLVGGTLVVETVFSLPGLGRLLVDSLQARDVVVTLDIIVLGAVSIVIATMAADALAARLDPRINS